MLTLSAVQTRIALLTNLLADSAVDFPLIYQALPLHHRDEYRRDVRRWELAVRMEISRLRSTRCRLD